jgi:hypothetical protein
MPPVTQGKVTSAGATRQSLLQNQMSQLVICHNTRWFWQGTCQTEGMFQFPFIYHDYIRMWHTHAAAHTDGGNHRKPCPTVS